MCLSFLRVYIKKCLGCTDILAGPSEVVCGENYGSIESNEQNTVIRTHSFLGPSTKRMFWAKVQDCPFRGVSLNANVVKFFISETEGVDCVDLDRIERITMAIDGDIHMRLCSMESVPPMVELFLKHYRDPANQPKQRDVSDC